MASVLEILIKDTQIKHIPVKEGSTAGKELGKESVKVPPRLAQGGEVEG